MDLQSSSDGYQDLDTHAVSARISNSSIPESMSCRGGVRDHLRTLDLTRFYIPVLPGRLLLGQDHRKREMPQPGSYLVLQCLRKHRARRRHSLSSHGGFEKLRHTQQAEESTHCRVRARGSVSRYSGLLSSRLLTSEIRVCLVSIIRLQTLVSVSNSTDPTFDNPPAAMLSAIETNIGIICACLPSMRPLLAAMMPVYFSGSSQYSNVTNWKHDVEQPKHSRGSSTGTLPYDSKAIKNPYESRSESPASQTYTQSRPNSGSHIRSESISGLPTPAAPLRSYSRASTHLRTRSDGSRLNAPDAAMELHNTAGHTRGDGRRTSVSAHQVSSQSSGLHNQGQPFMNPLRMSPFSPVIPRLPRLPENMAVMGTLESRDRSSGPGVQDRPTRTPFFHKPLPITPLPGHQHAPQYLTTAQDQAMLPVQLSPGLIPPPLKLGGNSS